MQWFIAHFVEQDLFYKLAVKHFVWYAAVLALSASLVTYLELLEKRGGPFNGTLFVSRIISKLINQLLNFNYCPIGNLFRIVMVCSDLQNSAYKLSKIQLEQDNLNHHSKTRTRIATPIWSPWKRVIMLVGIIFCRYLYPFFILDVFIYILFKKYIYTI